MLSRKQTWIIGLVFYSISLVYAGILFKERCLADTSWQIFYMVNTGKPCPSHYRWIGVLEQLPALIFTHIGLSLKSIMIINSMAPLLFSFVLFSISMLTFSSVWPSLAILFTTVFSVGEVFFQFPELEKYLFALLFVFFAFYLEAQKWKSRWGLLVLVTSYFFMAFSHPMAWSVMAFLPIYFATERDWTEMTFSGLLAALFIGFKLTTLDAYEAVNLGQRIQGSINLGELNVWEVLMGNLTLVVVFMLLVFGMVKSKKNKLMTIFIAFCLVYITIIVLRVDRSQVDPYFIPLGGLMTFLLFSLFMRSVHVFSGWRLPLLTALFLIDAGSIAASSSQARKNVQFLEDIIQVARKNGTKKLIFPDQMAPKDVVLDSFVYSETALFSSIDNPNGTTVCVPVQATLDKINEIRTYLSTKEALGHLPTPPINCNSSGDCIISSVEALYAEDYMEEDFGMWFERSLNSNYFNLGDSSFELLNESSYE